MVSNNLKNRSLATRVLISLISALSKEMVQEISPRSLSLHHSIKFQMVFMIWSCSLLSGISLVLLKCFGEIVTFHGFGFMPFVTIGCLISGICGCALFCLLLNLLMRYYNNIDVMPIYQSLT